MAEVSSSVGCSWQEFKQMAKEFNEAAPTLNLEELDNAWKCLGLGYLGMYEQMWQSSAAMLLNMMCRVYTTREIELNQ